MSINRIWGKSNLFSEGHRINLPNNFCLFDVDGILLDNERNPKFIYEGKYKRVSKSKGDFIDTFYHPTNLQASFLRIISEKIGVYIHEETTNLWWFVNDRTLEESENPNLDKIKTADRIYVEDIVNGYSHNLSGVFVRTEGEKPSEMEKYADLISDLISVPKVLVNDVFESDFIHFKREDKQVKCESESVWNTTWKDLELI
jgi:hypothetical protein